MTPFFTTMGMLRTLMFLWTGTGEVGRFQMLIPSIVFPNLIRNGAMIHNDSKCGSRHLVRQQSPLREVVKKGPHERPRRV